MKLFIYYSYYGNGDVVASYLKEKEYEIRKVNAKLKLSKMFFFAIMKGGFLATINKKPQLIDYNNDVSKYDEIYIGSPIWNGRLAPAINTVLKQTNLNDKKLTFILYSGSMSGPKADKKINKLYPNAKIIHLQEPKKYNNELNKLEVI